MSEQAPIYYCRIPSDELVNDAYPCLEWVAYYPSSLVEQLAITKGDMVLIGGSLTAVFALFFAFTVIARAANSL